MFSSPILSQRSSNHHPLTPQSQNRRNSQHAYAVHESHSPTFRKAQGIKPIILSPPNTPRPTPNGVWIAPRPTFSDYAPRSTRGPTSSLSQMAFDRRKQNQSNPLELRTKPGTSEHIRRKKFEQGVKERRDTDVFNKRIERRQQLEYFSQQRAWEAEMSKDAPSWDFGGAEEGICDDAGSFIQSSPADYDEHMTEFNPYNAQSSGGLMLSQCAKQEVYAADTDASSFLVGALKPVTKEPGRTHQAGSAQKEASDTQAGQYEAYTDENETSLYAYSDSEDEAAFEAELLDLVLEADRMDVSGD